MLRRRLVRDGLRTSDMSPVVHVWGCSRNGVFQFLPASTNFAGAGQHPTGRNQRAHRLYVEEICRTA